MKRTNQIDSKVNHSTTRKIPWSWKDISNANYIINDTGGPLTLKTGMLLTFHPRYKGTLKIAQTNIDIVNVVGILYVDNAITIVNGDVVPVPISCCQVGMVNQEAVVLPDSFTFETVLEGASKTVGDYLKDMLIFLVELVDNKKLDN